MKKAGVSTNPDHTWMDKSFSMLARKIRHSPSKLRVNPLRNYLRRSAIYQEKKRQMFLSRYYVNNVKLVNNNIYYILQFFAKSTSLSSQFSLSIFWRALILGKRVKITNATKSKKRASLPKKRKYEGWKRSRASWKWARTRGITQMRRARMEGRGRAFVGNGKQWLMPAVVIGEMSPLCHGIWKKD